MITQAYSDDSKRGVADSFGDVIGDVVTLADLQFDLLKLDSAESGRDVALPIAAIVIGLFTVAGTAPVLLLLISAALYEFTELSMTASIGIATGIGVVIGGLAAWLGLRGLKKALVHFKRSSEELRRNVEWLKNLNKRNQPHKADTYSAGRRVALNSTN